MQYIQYKYLIVLRCVRDAPRSLIRSCTDDDAGCSRVSSLRFNTVYVRRRKVVLAARNEEKLKAVAEEIKASGGEAAVAAGDASKVCTSSVICFVFLAYTRTHEYDYRSNNIA